MAKDKETSKEERGTLEKLIPVLLIASIALAFLVGVLWQKVNILEKGGTVGTKEQVAGDVKQPASPPPNGKLSEEQAERLPEITDGDHKRGDDGATVYLIEYSDLECPFCKKFHPTIKEVVEKYEGKVSWVYRHFPLDMLHPKARAEAEATECAAEQGGEDAFWALLDKIYEETPSNNGLDLDDLPIFAEEVGLDGDKLQDCIDSGKYKDRVENQYKGAAAAGVSGTPATFIVNDKGEVWLMPGAIPANALESAIEEALGN
jgi:protein-disulfide isomerase